MDRLKPKFSHSVFEFGFFLAVLIAASLTKTTVAFGQDAAWNNSGPVGSYTKVVAVDPMTTSTIYFGGIEDDPSHPYWGVYKSMDGGVTWTAMNNGLPNGYGVIAIVIDRTNPSTLYIGMQGYNWLTGGGVFKSTNGGASWTALTNGLPPDIPVSTVVMHPTMNNVLYAGTFGSGNYISTDGGNSWTAINNGLTDSYVHTIVINPQDPSNVFAGTTTGGVFASLDGGNTWTAANNGLPANSEVLTLAIDPSGTNLYAGTTMSGVFKSGIAGTWTDANAGLPSGSEIHSLFVDPAHAGRLYVGIFFGGVFMSTDSATTWQDLHNDSLWDNSVHTLALDPINFATLYAGTCNNGVFVLQLQ